MVASQNGHVEAVDKLLQHGASVDLQSKVSVTLLNSLYKCMNIASHTYHEQNGASSLISASENGHVEVVDKLLQHGAKADLQENVCVINPCTTSPFNPTDSVDGMQ